MAIKAAPIAMQDLTTIVSGLNQHSCGTSFQVLHANVAGALPTDNKDPYRTVASGNGSHDDNARPIPTERCGLWTDIFLLWGTTVSGDLCTTAPKVRIFGKLPKFSSEAATGADRAWPEDDDSTKFQAQKAVGWWIPLCDTTNQYLITLPNTSLENRAASSPYSYMAEPVRLYLKGCTQLVCLLDTAGVFATPASTKGVILARFVA